MSRKYPTSNSQIPYCDEYEEDHRIQGTVLNAIQREAEQELEYAERVLHEADDLVAENKECYRRRGCQKRQAMYNQSQNKNVSKQRAEPCRTCVPQDFTTSYYTPDSDFTEQYDRQYSKMTPSTLGQSDMNKCDDSFEQYYENYRRPGPFAQDLSGQAKDDFCSDDSYLSERPKQFSASRPRNFASTSYLGKNLRKDSRPNMYTSQFSEPTYHGSDIGSRLRPCRKETCPMYTCAEDEDKICKNFAVCEKGFVQRKMWPKKTAATQDQLQQMVENESRDVDLTLSLTAQEKKTYKKPCPKQQRAQMSVQHILQAHESNKFDTCVPKEYGPLVDPDPEDISPDLAAAMMFAQEQGIKLDACPQNTIQHLFPDDNLKKIPGSTISVADPKQGNQGDKEKLVQRSSKVSEAGASHSAYTKIMKQKGDAKGNKKLFEPDGDDADDKKEYVLVPEKPERFNMIQVRGNAPPWFPGFFTAFPEAAGIRILDSPSKVFLKAWKLVYPGEVPASDIIVLD